ncbi:hypothetical protein V8C35DRAFT_265685 [Trichoderma chlorosporum]
MHQPTFSQVNEWERLTEHWHSAAEPLHNYSPQDSMFLFEYCWMQINVTQLHVFSWDEFWETSRDLAKDENVTNGDEFVKKLKEKVKSRVAESGRSIKGAWHQSVYCANIFPCEDASNRVATICHDPSLINFIQLLQGIAFGWKSDIKQDTDKFINRYANSDMTQHFVDNHYCGPAGSDYESTDNTLDSAIHLDTEPTQENKQSQRKRYKRVRFGFNPDDNNKRKSNLQMAENDTADPSSSFIKYTQEEMTAKRLKRQREESTDPSSSFIAVYSSEDTEEERPAKRSKHQQPEDNTADPSSFFIKHAQEEKTAERFKRQREESTDPSSSFIAVSSSKDTEEERPTKRSKRQQPEDNTADPSSFFIKYAQEEKTAKRSKRQTPQRLTANSPSHILPSSVTKEKRPAERSNRSRSQSCTTDPLNTRTLRRSKRIKMQLGRGGKPSDFNGKLMEI